jgi:hypothetical protein
VGEGHHAEDHAGALRVYGPNRPSPDQPSHQQHRAVHSNRFVDVVAMSIHGSSGEIVPSGDFLGGPSIRHQQRNLELPLREPHAARRGERLACGLAAMIAAIVFG